MSTGRDLSADKKQNTSDSDFLRSASEVSSSGAYHYAKNVMIKQDAASCVFMRTYDACNVLICLQDDALYDAIGRDLAA